MRLLPDTVVRDQSMQHRERERGLVRMRTRRAKNLVYYLYNSVGSQTKSM